MVGYSFHPQLADAFVQFRMAWRQLMLPLKGNAHVPVLTWKGSRISATSPVMGRGASASSWSASVLEVGAAVLIHF